MVDLKRSNDPIWFTDVYRVDSEIIKDEVLLTVSCPNFPSKNLLTGSLKNRSIDNLETQKKSISMKNSQFVYAKPK